MGRRPERTPSCPLSHGRLPGGSALTVRSGGASVRLLVVDDDAVFRDEVSTLVRDEGHVAETAPSVAKAIEQLEHEEFDVVLTDLKMPRQSGLELLREVRARWPRTLVIVITGFATVETALEAMKLGAFDYLRKPFRVEPLRAALELARQERQFEAPPGTTRDPAREARTLAADGRHEVLYVGGPPLRAQPHLHTAPLDPASPERLIREVETFVAEHPNAAVVIAGLERMVESHRLEDIVATIDRVRDLLGGHGPLRLAFDPDRTPGAAALALGGAVASAETHAAFEAFANPIRRRVLERLAQGPAPFGELMGSAGLDDSPKMSFHLHKLRDAGLLAHEGEMYRLTPRGRAGQRLLLEATFLPPAGESDNVAFARTPPKEGPARHSES
jgi:DNA-binding response OmpR family regulator